MGTAVSTIVNARATDRSTPVAAASLEEAYNIDGSRLLDLPVDLLTLVLSFLNPESLTTLRRTCKVLDAVTFDRFTEENFAHIYCWIYTPDALERLKDILQNSPRLRAAIREVTLTDNYLEDQPWSNMHVVSRQNEHISNQQVDTAHPYLWERSYRSAGSALIHRVLLDLQHLPQHITINVDLSWHFAGADRYFPACQAVFFALITSHTNVHNLAVAGLTFKHLDDIFAHSRDDFMASMSDIHALDSTIHEWQTWPTSENAQPLFTEILRSAKKLEHLSFDISMFVREEVTDDRNCALLNVPSEILLVGNYSNLKSLKLVHLALSEHDLSQVLQQCQQTLSHLNLRRVRLTSGDGGWKRVGEILLAASKLAFLQLQMIYVSDDPYTFPAGYKKFRCSEVRDGNPPGITIRGRENVVGVSERLSFLGASLFEQLS